VCLPLDAVDALLPWTAFSATAFALLWRSFVACPKKEGELAAGYARCVGCVGGIYGVGVQSGLNWAANACA